ncbi:hypothetical protein PFAG_03061 [Plasmodium falciparum Santa Lucia]|uniref:Uncharacterized protein n=5 Tax=Plasmodium falciparum TaxID=5833 RepID=W4J2G3_PLAFP|nr:hypothetical protein PFFVO_03062 [Plasmodium falciparum Vietnam Oak-Knoll (FVO)]ETW42554.1 hypothetical protein PFNF135_03213 [Plasmodium falciparum NF135/5.C10]ETW56458.1 hypothetical protein PFUGPA_01629 [Plasmodium falciparum Palo Alto/Uganda]ETW61184.1 hypothetical protein PFMC_03048 [Plasmodium falciparum CAMP/Malaysia]EUT85369.1 hypothetical protein PFAG_03061 [Plasmodium falciparum Santa Lucia]
MEKKKFIKIRAIKYSMNEKKEKNFYQLFFILYKDNFTFICYFNISLYINFIKNFTIFKYFRSKYYLILF